MLSREQFLALADDIPSEEVPLPDGSTWVRGMTAADRDRFEVIMSQNGRANYRAYLAVFCVCTPDGKRFFTEADAPALGQIPAAILDPVATAALRLSRMLPSDVEELRKNSASGPSGDSA